MSRAKELVTAAQEELHSMVKFLEANNLTYIVEPNEAKLLATARKGESISDDLFAVLVRAPYNALYPAFDRRGQLTQLTIPLPAQHKLNRLQRKAGFQAIQKGLDSE